MKAALLDGELGPPNFNKETIYIAQQHGIVIEERYSKMGEEKYLANICSSCHQVWGDFFLRSFYHDEPDERVPIEQNGL